MTHAHAHHTSSAEPAAELEHATLPARRRDSGIRFRDGRFRDGRPFGPRLTWARDFALVGFATPAVGVGALALFHPSALVPAVALGIVGAGLGGLVGWLGPTLLSPFVRRIPVLVLLAAGAGLGACTGALVAAPFELLLAPQPRGALLLLGAWCGMAQLGWFWLPYALQRVRGRSTAPLIAVAAFLSPIFAAISLVELGML